MTMSPDPFSQALAALELGDLPDASALKRAYRAATVKHPPDVDAEGFQRVRAAYELLQNPLQAARQALGEMVPRVPPPRLLPPTATTRGELSVLLLRASIRRVSARALLSEG